MMVLCTHDTCTSQASIIARVPPLTSGEGGVLLDPCGTLVIRLLGTALANRYS